MRLRSGLPRLAAETDVQQRRSAMAASRRKLEFEGYPGRTTALSLLHGLERWTLPARMLATYRSKP